VVETSIRFLRVEPSDATPIWSQIEEGVRRLVASGALSSGAPMPSVRDLARELSINPATVAKAYQRLTDAGVLAVRRGEGTYVADRPPRMTRSEKVRVLRDGAARYATVAAGIGAERSEAERELGAAFDSLAHGDGQGETS
jgi:DNA-binding transcriptional regulator YhcF (GntR family)